MEYSCNPCVDDHRRSLSNVDCPDDRRRLHREKVSNASKLSRLALC